MNSIDTVSVELYRVDEYSFPEITILLYRFFKNFELEYNNVDRLVEDEDLFLSWAMSICSSENADLIKATVKLNGVAYDVVYSTLQYKHSYDLYLPVPQLIRIKRIYLIRNDISILNRVVLKVDIQDSNIVVYDFSNDQLYVFSSPVRLFNKSSIKGVIVEFQDFVTFVTLEGKDIKNVKTVKKSRKRKKKRARKTRRKKKK